MLFAFLRVGWLQKLVKAFVFITVYNAHVCLQRKPWNSFNCPLLWEDLFMEQQTELSRRLQPVTFTLFCGDVHYLALSFSNRQNWTELKLNSTAEPTRQIWNLKKVPCVQKADQKKCKKRRFEFGVSTFASAESFTLQRTSVRSVWVRRHILYVHLITLWLKG